MADLEDALWEALRPEEYADLIVSQESKRAMTAELLAEFQFVSTIDELNQWYPDAHACGGE